MDSLTEWSNALASGQSVKVWVRTPQLPRCQKLLLAFATVDTRLFVASCSFDLGFVVVFLNWSSQDSQLNWSERMAKNHTVSSSTVDGSAACCNQKRFADISSCERQWDLPLFLQATMPGLQWRCDGQEWDSKTGQRDELSAWKRGRLCLIGVRLTEAWIQRNKVFLQRSEAENTDSSRNIAVAEEAGFQDWFPSRIVKSFGDQFGFKGVLILAIASCNCVECLGFREQLVGRQQELFFSKLLLKKKEHFRDSLPGPAWEQPYHPNNKTLNLQKKTSEVFFFNHSF